jgi:hypothetical protein
MSTSEQHDTRRDPMSGEAPLVDDEYAADQRQDSAVDFGDQDRAGRERTSGDPTFAPDDTAHTDPSGAAASMEEPLVSDAPAAEDTQQARTDGTVAADRGRGDTTADSTDRDATPDRAPLVSAERADSYASRWNEVKGMFVDEPRQAVQQADQLVGELLDDLERGFREQRQGIERGLENDDTSTEDLRMALRRYRSFFDRLLSV